jgi:aerobic-type carbon monoxide dehydrogenase small subunit (CoxS/CutS family)
MSKHRRTRNPSGAISRRNFIKGASAVAAAAGLVRVGESKATPGSPSVEGATEVLGPGEVPVELTINGARKTLLIEPRVTLARALREHLGMTGTKLACDRGSCGACTVHLDGKPIVSCMVLAVDARRHAITTIEGLGRPTNLHPVQARFIDLDALQCGFCTPGMVMSVTAAIDKYNASSIEDFRRATSGNICRCGTYQRVLSAAVAASPKSGFLRGS